MAKYGNILTVLNLDLQTQIQVEDILTAHQTDFIFFNGLYYVETNSMANTSAIIRALKNGGLGYVFFHNHISDSSEVKVNNVETLIEDHIKHILLE